MNKCLLFLVFLIGCSPVNSQSCDLCGKWSFDRFEYAGYITTDCENTVQQFFENTYISITENTFIKTYHIDNRPTKIDNIQVLFGEYDFEAKATVFFINTNGTAMEKFYMLDSNTVYLNHDGCRFYFKRI